MVVPGGDRPSGCEGAGGVSGGWIGGGGEKRRRGRGQCEVTEGRGYNVEHLTN